MAELQAAAAAEGNPAGHCIYGLVAVLVLHLLLQQGITADVH